MTNVNMGLKSALLALTLMVAVPTPTARAGEAVALNPVIAIIDFAKNHPYFVSSVIAFCAAAEFDLRTKAKADYKLSDLPDDIKDILKSNIFSSELYKKLLTFMRKYGFGLAVKIDEQIVRTKNDDGSTTSLKSKKLTQKPFGLYGLFDAYALMHMKKFTEYVPVIAGFYVLLNNPVQLFENAAAKAASASKK